MFSWWCRTKATAPRMIVVYAPFCKLHVTSRLRCMTWLSEMFRLYSVQYPQWSITRYILANASTLITDIYRVLHKQDTIYHFCIQTANFDFFLCLSLCDRNNNNNKKKAKKRLNASYSCRSETHLLFSLSLKFVWNWKGYHLNSMRINMA